MVEFPKLSYRKSYSRICFGQLDSSVRYELSDRFDRGIMDYDYNFPPYEHDLSHRYNHLTSSENDPQSHVNLDHEKYSSSDYYASSYLPYRASGSGPPYPGTASGNSALSFSGHYGHHKCCPLVVDPLCMVIILGGLAYAVYFLNVLITMTLSKRRRKKRDETGDGMFRDFIVSGTEIVLVYSHLYHSLG